MAFKFFFMNVISPPSVLVSRSEVAQYLRSLRKQGVKLTRGEGWRLSRDTDEEGRNLLTAFYTSVNTLFRYIETPRPNHYLELTLVAS